MSSYSYYELSKQYSEAQLKSKAGFNGYRKPLKDESGVYWCNCNIPVLVSPLNKGQAHCLRCDCAWYH
jgi:hypothetical protein